MKKMSDVCFALVVKQAPKRSLWGYALLGGIIFLVFDLLVIAKYF